MERLLKFVSDNNQHEKKKKVPFLLLLPHYVYTKRYYQEYFQSDARGTSVTGTSDKAKHQLFYLVPSNRYAYEPPSWVNTETGSTALARGKTQTAPFPTFWYCHVPSLQQNNQTWLTQTFGTSGQPPSKHNENKLQYANCTAHLPREFKGEFDVTNKRPNPRARKRAAMKKQFSGQPQAQTQRQPVAGRRKKKRY